MKKKVLLISIFTTLMLFLGVTQVEAENVELWQGDPLRGISGYESEIGNDAGVFTLFKVEDTKNGINWGSSTIEKQYILGDGTQTTDDLCVINIERSFKRNQKIYIEVFYQCSGLDMGEKSLRANTIRGSKAVVPKLVETKYDDAGHNGILARIEVQINSVTDEPQLLEIKFADNSQSDVFITIKVYFNGGVTLSQEEEQLIYEYNQQIEAKKQEKDGARGELELQQSRKNYRNNIGSMGFEELCNIVNTLSDESNSNKGTDILVWFDYNLSTLYEACTAENVENLTQASVITNLRNNGMNNAGLFTRYVSEWNSLIDGWTTNISGTNTDLQRYFIKNSQAGRRFLTAWSDWSERRISAEEFLVQLDQAIDEQESSVNALETNIRDATNRLQEIDNEIAELEELIERFTSDEPDTGEDRETHTFTDVLSEWEWYSDKANEYNEDTTQLTNKVNVILTIIVNIGMILSVLMSAFIGIKYMLGSVEEKAEYKKDLIPYIVGSLLLFGITAIVKIMLSIGQSINNA